MDAWFDDNVVDCVTHAEVVDGRIDEVEVVVSVEDCGEASMSEDVCVDGDGTDALGFGDDGEEFDSVADCFTEDESDGETAFGESE